MKRTFNIIRIISRHTWWWTFALIIVLAITLTLARIFLPQLEHYRHDVEMKVSAVIGQPVSIAGFEVGWRGLGPRLLLHDVRVMDRSGENLLLGFDSALIDISVPDSLYHAQIEFGDFTLVGVELNVVRDTEGRYSLGGVSLPAESEAAKRKKEDEFNILAWVARQPYLALKESIIRWRDVASATELEFEHVNINMQYVQGRHLLAGQVSLPAAMGREVELILNATGSVHDVDSLDINFYFKGADLQFSQWLVDHAALGSLTGMRIVNGSAQIELWGRWYEKRLREVRGDIELRDLYLAYDEFSDAMGVTVHRFDSLSGEFVWQGDNKKWQLDIDQFLATRGGDVGTPARIHVAQTKYGNGREFEVATDFARVEELSNVAVASSMLPDQMRSLISQLRPRGEIHNSYVRLRLQPGQAAEYFVRADLKNMALRAREKMPGVEGFDVALNLDQQGGVADLDASGVNIDTQGVFRDGLALDSVSGRIAWQNVDNGVELDVRQLAITNKDVGVQLDGSVDVFNDNTSPMVSLLADIRRANGAAIHRYLPVNKLSEKTVAWLDRSIVAGDVTSGAMVLQGPIKQFPFNDGSGRFEVRFNVSDGILDYTEGWPRIEQIEAEVGFTGSGMDILTHEGKILASSIRNVKVAVADFGAQPAAVLTVDGEANGPSADVIRFLNETPLQARFGSVTGDAEASGQSHLGLSLRIPLAGDVHVSTDGWVNFKDSAVQLKHLGVDLEDINGKVGFSDQGLSADAVNVDIMGQPATLSIRTEAVAKDETNIVFDAQGETHLEALSQRVSLMVLDHLEGKAAWQARLEIPVRRDNDAHPVLQVTSDLVGISVNLPSTLGKMPQTARDFDLFTEFNSQDVIWYFDYDGEALTGIFEMVSHNGQSALNRAELHANGDAVLPDDQAFRLAGRLDEFDSEQWWPILFAEKDTASAQGDESMTVTQLDLAFGRATLFEQPFHEVKIKAQRIPGGWDADVDSQELKGNVTLPDDFSQPLQMELSRLYLQDKAALDEIRGEQPASQPESPFDPRELPPLIINSADARYGDAQLGRMALVATRSTAGLSVDRLHLNSDRAEISLQGSWVQDQLGGQVAFVKGDLKVHDLGKLMSGFGYTETIVNGEGTASLSLKWDGSLLAPDLATMAGVVRFDFNDGRLLEVEPGAGRFFGLFSVQALPRRLILDFSDFFGKGLAFDYMRGRFEVGDGNAITDNFTLDGPAVSVTLKGRVGLVDRDYDQQIKVIPHVTSGLPLVGAAIGGLSVGAAVLLVEKLLKRKINEATEIYYHITGSWDDPVITQLSQ